MTYVPFRGTPRRAFPTPTKNITNYICREGPWSFRKKEIRQKQAPTLRCFIIIESDQSIYFPFYLSSHWKFNENEAIKGKQKNLRKTGENQFPLQFACFSIIEQ